MPCLGIHVFLPLQLARQDVDGRDKPGHEGEWVSVYFRSYKSVLSPHEKSHPHQRGRKPRRSSDRIEVNVILAHEVLDVDARGLMVAPHDGRHAEVRA
jgi:hypothetical protein